MTIIAFTIKRSRYLLSLSSTNSSYCAYIMYVHWIWYVWIFFSNRQRRNFWKPLTHIFENKLKSLHKQSASWFRGR